MAGSLDRLFGPALGPDVGRVSGVTEAGIIGSDMEGIVQLAVARR